jgi:hypothetical protein
MRPTPQGYAIIVAFNMSNSEQLHQARVRRLIKERKTYRRAEAPYIGRSLLVAQSPSAEETAPSLWTLFANQTATPVRISVLLNEVLASAPRSEPAPQFFRTAAGGRDDRSRSVAE